MYYPSKYKKHNESLNNLINIFNNTAKKLGSEIKMCSYEKENYKNDGEILYQKTNEKIYYDFEKRHNHYPTCKQFVFKTLGQFERKIEKTDTKLSIQACTDESCFIIAWHEDYKKEEKRFIKSSTENGAGESSAKRFTSDFLEIKYKNIEIFYKILLKAFREQSFNKNSFNIDSDTNKCEYLGCSNSLSENVYSFSIRHFNGKKYCYYCQQKIQKESP